MSSVKIVGKNLYVGDLLDHLMNYSGVVGLDTETEGINPKKEAPACGKGRIVCWSVSTSFYPRVFLWGKDLHVLKPWLASADHKKCGHNIYGFDKHMFANHDITLRGIESDTLRLSRLLYCSKERSHGLKALALHQLGIAQPSFASLFMRPAHRMEFVQEGRKKKGVFIPMQYVETKRKVGDKKGVPTILATGERGKFGKALEFIPLSQIPTDYPDRLEALYDYATLDADITRQLHYKLKEQLERKGWKVAK